MYFNFIEINVQTGCVNAPFKPTVVLSLSLEPLSPASRTASTTLKYTTENQPYTTAYNSNFIIVNKHLVNEFVILKFLGL